MFDVADSDTAVERTALAEIGQVIPGWNEAAAGRPVKWFHSSGSNIQVHPKAVRKGTLTVHGYTVPDEYADSTAGIAAGFVPALLNRAEALARRMRAGVGNNLELADDLDAQWLTDCDEIYKSAQGR